MKNFVSQELKGLKQEHRLLSLHIGACESIMKKKTKQDFQELIKTEHGDLAASPASASWTPSPSPP